MPSRSVLAVVPAPRSAVGWRSDLDPAALPPTPDLTLGQRRVLQACVELFAEQGFAGSSIRDIATAAGLQSASLYNHFPSKDAMLSALMLMGHEQHLDRITTAAINAESHPVGQLTALVREHVLTHCEFPRLGLITNRERRFVPAETAPQIDAIRARSSAITRDILQRGADQGVFHLYSMHVTLLALASMGVDAARWYPYQNEIEAEALASDYANLALRMVGASTP